MGFNAAETVLDDAVSGLRTRMIVTWVFAGLFIIYGCVMMYLYCRAKTLIARGPVAGPPRPPPQMQMQQQRGPP